MKQLNQLRSIMAMVCFISGTQGFTQATTIGNTPVNPTDYLGWNAVTGIPLEIRHDANRNIEWWTNGDKRMHLSPEVLGQNVNGYPGLNLTGYFGVGEFFNGYPHPAARLHLENNSSVTNGYRPMMGEGTLVTQGESLFYSGLLDDGTSGVLWSKWSSVSTPPATLRFIYTGDNIPGTVSEGPSGLELGRFEPDASLNEGYFGVGDWNTAGVVPNERLDILDRTVKIRRLIPDYNNNSLDNVVVADANGVLHWRDASTLGGTTDCDWIVDPGTTAGSNNLVTAFGPATANCPDETEAVGIGTATPGAKLDIVTSQFATAFQVDQTTNSALVHGAKVTADGGTTQNFGVHVTAEQGSGASSGNTGLYVEAVNSGSTAGKNQGIDVQLTGTTSYRTKGVNAETDGAQYTAYAGHFIARDNASFVKGVEGYTDDGISTSTGSSGIVRAEANVNLGVSGDAKGTGTKQYIGVRGKSEGMDVGAWVAGVYGKATGHVNNTNVWAFYGEGEAYTTGSWTSSDAMFKDNVQDITNAAGLISQLDAKTYDFNTADYHYMNFSNSQQYGLIAQDVEGVLPDLVREVTRPAEYDSLGNVSIPQLTFKAMNYTGLVPILIAAFNEQQQRIDDLEAMVQDCCTSGGLDHRNEDSGNTGGTNSGSAVATDLTISPNPFSTNTTLRFNLSEEEDARVVATDQRGKEIATLFQARTSGPQQVEWDTNMLPDGMYYVSLYVDDELIVKKAVKMAR